MSSLLDRGGTAHSTPLLSAAKHSRVPSEYFYGFPVRLDGAPEATSGMAMSTTQVLFPPPLRRNGATRQRSPVLRIVLYGVSYRVSWASRLRPHRSILCTLFCPRLMSTIGQYAVPRGKAPGDS